ncbi:MAG: hypothetical protein QOF71_1634 [Candidatus Eremiobacteraeota bacterium]|jgi:cytochrome c biogenesis protein ResB|nr:hypothetical protein [Candidatus Eremiobacteraeota bacterium]
MLAMLSTSEVWLILLIALMFVAVVACGIVAISWLVRRAARNAARSAAAHLSERE